MCRKGREKMNKRFHECFRSIAIMVLLLAGATAAGGVFRQIHLHDSDVVIVYLLAVLLTARLTKGHCYGLAASILSFLLFNWFFTYYR